MPLEAPVLRVLGDILDAQRKLMTLAVERDALTGKPTTMMITADTVDAKAKMFDIAARWSALQKDIEANPVPLNAEGTSKILAEFASIGAAWKALEGDISKGLINTPGLAGIAMLESAVTRLGLRMENLKRDAKDSIPVVETMLSRLMNTPLTQAGGGWGGILGKLTLFGGAFGSGNALNSVSYLHLLIDTVGELAAVWIPATLAVGAWGFAASDAFKTATQTAQDYNTLADGIGGKIPGLTSNMVNLRKAVAPQVYQLFGDAMLVAGQKTGTFNTLVMGTGKVLDQLGARATAAITSGGMNTFTRGAVQDVSELGNAFGNLFGTLGNLLHAVPGVAGVLLHAGTDILGFTEKITGGGFVQGLLKGVMALHGFVIWAGLAATAAVYLGRMIVATASEGGILNTAFGFVKAGGIQALLTNPTTWAVAGVGAVAGLIVVLTQLKDATQLANQAQNNGILSATSMAKGQYLLAAGIKNTTAALHAQLQAAASAPMEVGPGAGRGAGAPSGRLVNQFDIGQNQGELNQLNTWSGTYRQHMNELAKSLGGAGAAQQYLAESGISFKQMIQDQGSAWLQDKLQVEATAKAYQALGYSTGTLGNSLQVLQRQQTPQYTAIQNINSAMQTWIGNVTGSQTAFDTFVSGNATLAQNWKAADGAGLSLTHHLGDLSGAFKTTHAAIDGLKPADLQLNQAFTSSVTNANSLIASLRTAGISGSFFTGAVKASIDPLVKYAHGSQEATAQLVALAEEAGYNGPNSLKELEKWLGSGKNATQALKDAANQATIQEALLSGSMKGQGQMIASQLLGQLNAAELKYSGLAGDVARYGKAIATSGAQSDAARAARQRLINDTVILGEKMHNTTGQTGALLAKLLGIPQRVAIQMVLNAQARIAMQENISEKFSYGTLSNGNLLPPKHGASGFLVPPGFAHDSFPAMLQSGETVVPSHLTPAVAPLMAAHHVPGFAAGGFVASRMASYTGPWGAGGDTYNLMVKGDTDPDAAALRIIKTVRAHKTKHGIRQTGIG